MNDAQKVCKQIKQAKQKKFDVNVFYKKVLDIFYKETSPEKRRTITVHKLKISACCKNTLKAKKQNESEK